MAVMQQVPTTTNYFQSQFASVPTSHPIAWKEGWDVNSPATKPQLSMIGPTSPAHSIASGISSASPRRRLESVAESDQENNENNDTCSEISDQPLYSAAVESFLGLKEPTPEDFKPCESTKSLIRPSKPRAVSFQDAKADIAEIWPFTETNPVPVKRVSLTSVDRERYPLFSVKPVVPAREEDHLLKLNLQTLSPHKSAEDRLKEAENLLVQFQNVYKTRSMSVHKLEKQVDDQASQLEESEMWSESLGRTMMSLTTRINEQESVIMQLGQELGKEKEKRREEEEEAFQHKLDGLNRIYPPVTEKVNRRMSTIPGVNSSQSSFNNNLNNNIEGRRESSFYTAPRSARHPSSASFSSTSGAQGYQRRPSFFARMFRQGSESSSSGSESPPQSRLSSFSSRASTYLTSKVQLAPPADKEIEIAVGRVKALEDVRNEVSVLRQKLESLELALSALHDLPPSGTVDVVLSP